MHLIYRPWSHSIPPLPPRDQEGNCRGKHGRSQASRETAPWGLGLRALLPNVSLTRHRKAPDQRLGPHCPWDSSRSPVRNADSG